MDVVTRAEWGAKPAKNRVALPASSFTEGVFVHYTAADSDRVANHADCAKRVQGIQAFHQGPSRNWSDIAYSFLVCQHGGIFEGRGLFVQGAHTVGFNSTAHAVCFLGGDKAGRDDVTENGRAALGEIVRHILSCTPGKDVVRGHRDVNPTACPGDELYAWVRVQGWKLEEPAKPATNWHGFWRWLAWNLGEGAYKDVGPRHLPSRPKVPAKVPEPWWRRREKFLEARK
jgi:hypothetical protein